MNRISSTRAESTAVDGWNLILRFLSLDRYTMCSNLVNFGRRTMMKAQRGQPSGLGFGAMLIMGSRATANHLVFELPCGTAYLPFNWQAPLKSTSFPYFVASGHFAQLDYNCPL